MDKRMVGGTVVHRYKALYFFQIFFFRHQPYYQIKHWKFDYTPVLECHIDLTFKLLLLRFNYGHKIQMTMI